MKPRCPILGWKFAAPAGTSPTAYRCSATPNTAPPRAIRLPGPHRQHRVDVGALLAINLSAWLQELAGLDTGDGYGRAHLSSLRHRLLNVAARLVRHGRRITLRLPQASNSSPRCCPAYGNYPPGSNHPLGRHPFTTRRPAHPA